MTPEPIGLVLERFEDPDEVRHMEKGKFELVHWVVGDELLEGPDSRSLQGCDEDVTQVD